MKRFRIKHMLPWLIPGLALMMILVLPHATFAAVKGDCGIDIFEDIPSTVNIENKIVVGQTYPARLEIENTSSFDEATLELEITELIITLSCKSTLNLKCNCASGDCDPGVFTIVGNVVGEAGTACEGITFTPTINDAATGEYLLTPDSVIVLQPSNVGGPLSTCYANFEVIAMKQPTKDARQVDCLQTGQLGYALLVEYPVDQDSKSGTGSGTSDVTFLCDTTVTTTPVPEGPVILGTEIRDCATVTRCDNIAPKGTVSFYLYPPTQPGCTGEPLEWLDIALDANDRACTPTGHIVDTVGIYQWVAKYSGDPNNECIDCYHPAESECGEEPVEAVKPCISVEKSVTPDKSKEGDPVTYTLGPVCNCGSMLLTDVTVDDTIFGDLTADFIPGGPPYELEPLECTGEVTKVYTIPPNSPDPLNNIITASGQPTLPNGQQVGPHIEADANASVDLFQPAIDVVKMCDDLSKLGDDVNYTITLSNNSSADTPAMICIATDSLLGEVFNGVLPPGNTNITLSREVQPGDPDPLVNTVTLTCSPEGFPDNVYMDSATCETDISQPEVCRTPGFWGTHACPQLCLDGTDVCEKSNSNNITQAAIDEAGGSIDICGSQVTNTVGMVEEWQGKNKEEKLSSDAGSAIEMICVSPEGDHQLQLIRFLTATALNCIVSNGSSDCTGISIGPIFQACNALCADPDDPNATITVQECIYALDCWDNGGNPKKIDYAWYCLPVENSCHDRMLGMCEDGTICTEENTSVTIKGEQLCQDGSICKPGPAGSSKACNAAIQNECTLFGGCELNESCGQQP